MTEDCDCGRQELIEQIGRVVGCNHFDCPDGRNKLVQCVEEIAYKNCQQFDVEIFGWNWFGVGKLTLTFKPGERTYTIWMLFLTKWLSFGIHVNCKGKK